MSAEYLPESFERAGLRFVLTCSLVPEQYDVFEGNEQVAYVRVRFSKTSMAVPDVGGEIVYFYRWPPEEDDYRGYKGGFDSIEERDRHIGLMIAALRDWQRRQ